MKRQRNRIELTGIAHVRNRVAGKAAFRVPGADSQGDRHDERGGESEHQLAQRDQDARRLPERGRGD